MTHSDTTEAQDALVHTLDSIQHSAEHLKEGPEIPADVHAWMAEIVEAAQAALEALSSSPPSGPRPIPSWYAPVASLRRFALAHRRRGAPAAPADVRPSPHGEPCAVGKGNQRARPGRSDRAEGPEPANARPRRPPGPVRDAPQVHGGVGP